MTNQDTVTAREYDRLIRIDEVKQLTSLSKTSINAWVAAGKFPAPAHLSSTIKVWRYADIKKWIDEIAFSNYANKA